MFYESEEMIETFLGTDDENDKHDEEERQEEKQDKEEDQEDEEENSFLKKINEHVCCKEEDMIDRGEDCLVYDFDGKIVHLIDTKRHILLTEIIFHLEKQNFVLKFQHLNVLLIS